MSLQLIKYFINNFSVFLHFSFLNLPTLLVFISTNYFVVCSIVNGLHFFHCILIGYCWPILFYMEPLVIFINSSVK